MAVILKNGASRASTREASGVPLRSSEITIARTGLITEIKTDGQVVNVLNLGYQGDHNVTSLRINTWKDDTGDFANRYIPAIVFFNEKTKISNTLSMNRNAKYYSVDIPQDITKDSGNYQMYFILKESLSADITEGGSIGSDDDPAYREVFVSDSWKGVVDDRSGFSLMPTGFTWETGLHNYNEGKITPYDWFEPSDNNYMASIYLAGLQAGKGTSDIKWNIPEEFEIVGTPSLGVATGDPEEDDVVTKTFTITLRPKVTLTSTQVEELLDKVIITYPVTFSATNFFDTNELHKVPIKIEHNPNSISAKDNQNLGMKYDSYITPIDVGGLRSLPGNTQKYVIFAKDNHSMVCESFGSYCWIPAEVTAQPGTWHVSFVVKNDTDDYLYYTGILKLPVIDNQLKQNDLRVDTAYKAVLDNEGSEIYDSNGYAMLVRSQTGKTVNLEHPASTINRAIGWVDAVSTEGIGAKQLITTINSLESIQQTNSTLAGDVADLKTTTSTNTTNISSLTTRVGEVEITLSDLNLDELESQVEENKTNISNLQTRVSTTETNINNINTKISGLENKDIELAGSIASNLEKISANEEKIAALETEDLSIKNTISDINGRVGNLRIDHELLEARTDSLGGKVLDLEDGYSDQAKYLVEEIANRATEDEKLHTKINKEIADREDAIDNLQNKINNEESRATTRELELQNDINQNKLDIEELNNSLFTEEKSRKEADDSLDVRATSLETKTNILDGDVGRLTAEVNGIKEDRSIIRNDYLGAEKVFVARIVFLSSEDEYNALERKESGTLYLIQEEEE